MILKNIIEIRDALKSKKKTAQIKLLPKFILDSKGVEIIEVVWEILKVSNLRIRKKETPK